MRFDLCRKLDELYDHDDLDDVVPTKPFWHIPSTIQSIWHITWPLQHPPPTCFTLHMEPFRSKEIRWAKFKFNYIVYILRLRLVGVIFVSNEFSYFCLMMSKILAEFEWWGLILHHSRPTCFTIYMEASFLK